LNRLAGLLSWSTDDPWESFLLVAAFWVLTLYGGEILRYAGPIIVVVLLILGMYSRRYSPLSSTSTTGEKHEPKGHKREASESTLKHHKTLDEIVETLREFTTRCNLLLDPFLRLTDFLSTQRTPTSATTRPALTTLFIRILMLTPLWLLLTIQSVHILTPRRIILTFGTIMLTWHSRPARVSRVILWRSLFLRRTASFITGLSFSTTIVDANGKLLRPSLPPRRKSQAAHATELAKKRRVDSPGVRFTFVLYENQRRWIGLGWTTSLFAYERGPWTDEHLNNAPTKEEFSLPDVEGGVARWRWIEGSSWKIEGPDGRVIVPTVQQLTGNDKGKDLGSDVSGWIYYDSKWQEGRKDDGWGRYTRRRKWFRDAELVEVTNSTEVTPSVTPNTKDALSDAEGPDKLKASGNDFGDDGAVEPRNEGKGSSTVKKRWFKRERSDSKNSSGKNTGKESFKSDRSRSDGPEEDVVTPWRFSETRVDYGFGDEAKMGLG
jgi:Integral peroxisomal membrane peroxin